MGDRKDDVRIYVICVFFFACSTTGGILLCLYIFLPTSQGGAPWFSILGLVLVAIPWIIWFLIYLYRCFKPMVDAQFDDRHNHSKPSGTPKSALLTEVIASPYGGGQESAAVHSSVDPDGERHVHFGAVVVVENGSGGSGGSQRQQQEAAVDRHEELAQKEPEEGILESEMPLTSATRS